MASSLGLVRVLVVGENASVSKKKRTLSPEVRKYSSPTWSEASVVNFVIGWEERGNSVSRLCVVARRVVHWAGVRYEGMRR